MRRIGKRVADADRKDLKGLLMSDWDRKNLEFLIAFYEKAYPGVIKWHADDARKDPRLAHKNKDFNKRMAMPRDLWYEILRGYPALMTDRAQFEQFLKWFPQFDLWVE